MKVVRIGIAGFGTVGQGAAAAVAGNGAEIESRSGIALRVTAVCRRSPIAPEKRPDGARACTDWRKLVAADDVDVVVETMGGTGDAREAVRMALRCGKPVVTANKNLIAEHGDELFALAKEKQLPIGMEAAVGGAVPMLRAISECMSGDRLLAVRGILNGTANYILTTMENDAVEMEQALAMAQRAGYAEANPLLDVDGVDARDKLCILARLAFGGRLSPRQIPTTGIRQVSAVDVHYARRLGGAIRLIAAAERNGSGLEVSVQPWLVARESMLAGVQGTNNAVFLDGERAGTQVLYGRGAGAGPTGIAVVSDLVDIARNLAAGALRSRPLPGFAGAEELALSSRHRAVPWYLRLTVRDRPGIVARVAEAIARQHINIDSVVQEPNMTKERLSFVITVEPVSMHGLQPALQEINELDFMLEPVMVLRME